jgi:hypothetical protein
MLATRDEIRNARNLSHADRQWLHFRRPAPFEDLRDHLTHLIEVERFANDAIN